MLLSCVRWAGRQRRRRCQVPAPAQSHPHVVTHLLGACVGFDPVFASAGKTAQAHDTHNAAAAVHAQLRARHQRQVAAGNIEICGSRAH